MIRPTFYIKMIEISGKYLQPSSSVNYIEKGVPIVKKDISYEEFFEQFLVGNQPCIFESDFTSHWKSRKEWVLQDSGMPNFEFLSNTFGSAKVPVADCNDQYYNSQMKIEDTVVNFIEYWKNYCDKGYPEEFPCLYLKDWHFPRDYPDYEAYHWPLHFAADWLNEFWMSKPDDYRFVTPMHVDVLTSYSWSSNICGRKRWLLFPPGNEKKLVTHFGEMPFLCELAAPEDQAILVEQEAGETIFVPSGWYHQVWNLEDTISINHNWLNGCCIAQAWAGLKNDLRAVKKELSDCMDMEGWEEQCQVVLAANTGSNLYDFFNFLDSIAQTRLRCLDDVDTPVSFHWTLGKNHARILPDVA
ncbi:hypothetical protein B566_EDAN005996, partial [Ephemera danica]